MHISVLMPAWNAQATIGEAIDSILSQTYPQFELIVLDDGSTDATWQIMLSWRKKDGRVRVLRNRQNQGIGVCRNQLVKLAKGEYLAWQDADDVSYPQRLELQRLLLDSQPKVGMVGGALDFVDARGLQSRRCYSPSDAQLRARIFRYSPVAQPVAMIRSECFKKVGWYEPAFAPAEDIDMAFRIGALYQFANVDQPLLRYRVSQLGATFQHLWHIQWSTGKIRLHNLRNTAYRFTLVDLLFNLAQYALVVWLPPSWQLTLFNLLRNQPVHS